MKISSGQIRPGEISTSQIREPHVSTFQIGLRKIGPVDVDARKNGWIDVVSDKFAMAQVSSLIRTAYSSSDIPDDAMDYPRYDRHPRPTL